jgi:hypothetical protein
MEKKIIAILVMTLLISAGGIAVAHWDEDPGWHKMHYPQLPDPDGMDVMWGNWILADDFECSEGGELDEIHFWFSFKDDNEQPLTKLYVSIWSNNPGPPSRPDELQKSWIFNEDDFKIDGPWEGNQGWYNPVEYDYDENDHVKYWQVNIWFVEDPFIQSAGEIYWLAIHMGDNIHDIGWKTSESEQFMDTAVYRVPGSIWRPFFHPVTQQRLDLAFVVNDAIELIPPEEPDIIANPNAFPHNPWHAGVIAVDPSKYPISYYVDWGDGTTEEWSEFMPSGAYYNVSHTYAERGKYVVRAKAKNVLGAESEWGTFDLNVPRYKMIQSPLFDILLKRFPLLQLLFQ